VFLGAAFLTVAAAAVLSIYALPPSSTDREVTTEIPPSALSTNESQMALLYGLNDPSATMTLRWSSDAPMSAALYEAPGCPTPSASCIRGAPVASWTGNLSGVYSCEGATSYPYLLVWTYLGPGHATVQASAVSHESVRGSYPILTAILVDSASGILGVAGAVLVFLGLFLRGGYREGAKAPPLLSPEDLVPEAGEGRPITGPRTGPPDDGSGRPPRGPPAPGRSG